MRRLLLRLGLASAVAITLYACGGDDTTEQPPPGADSGSPGDDGSTGSDGTTSNDGNTSNDGSSGDGGVDGSSDASVDAPVDTGPPDAGPPAVRFVGRFDTAPVGGPKVAFPGAQIIARFDGTSVSATFSDEMIFNDYGPSRWAVLVDDVEQTPLSISRAQDTYVLATGLAAGPHKVELSKMTEASVGTSQFMGFDFGAGTLLPPPPAKTRHIEFLGDSASNGYGVEGASAACSFSAATQNARKGYPFLVAQSLNADHQSLTTSGKGVSRNYYHPDTEVFATVYQRTLPFVGGSAWDFADYTPDVVWITLGGNDYDPGFPTEGAPNAATFQTKYTELVTLVRTKHPAAHIFCAVAPSLTDTYPAGFNAYTSVKTALANVVAAKNGAGDAKVYSFEFTRSVNADLTACEGHPNAAKHTAMAAEAVTFIKTKTGWL